MGRVMRALRGFFAGAGSNATQPRRRRSRQRDHYVEALESRTLLTAVFQPVFGAESTSSDDDSHMSQPPIYIIFWGGTYWNSHPQSIHDILLATAGMITSPFPHIVDQYGADGSNMVIGDWVIDNSEPDNNNFDEDDIDDIVSKQLDSGRFPDPGSVPHQPINIVITPPEVLSDDSEAAGFNNVEGVFSQNADIWASTRSKPNGEVDPDNVSLTISHEIAEIMSDYNQDGYEVDAGAQWFDGGDDQIGDREGNSYTFRMSNGVLVQPVWSRADNAWAVDDGNSQDFNFTPIWNGTHFTGQYILNINGDQGGLGENDDVTVGTDAKNGVFVTFNGETESFDNRYISEINIDTKTGVSNTVHLNALPANVPMHITSTGGFVTIVGANSSNKWDITGPNSGNVNGITFSRAPHLVGGNLDDTFTFEHNGVLDGDVDGVDGGGGVNTIVGPSDFNFWSITGHDAGGLDLHSPYSNVQNITGGGAKDFFDFEGDGFVSGTLDGGGFSDTNDRDVLSFTDYLHSVTVDLSNINKFSASVINKFQSIFNINGSVIDDTFMGQFGIPFDINGHNSGNIFGINFSSFENLVGVYGESFVFKPGGSVSGNISTIPNVLDTLDYSALPGPVTVDFSTGKASNIGGTFSGISNVIGSQSGNDTIIGPDAQWNITGADSGTVNDISFSSFENLVGPDGPDTFSFFPGGSVSGNIDGGGGDNTLDFSQIATPITFDLAHNTVTGVGGTFSNIDGFVGGSGQNNVVGPDQPTTYVVKGHNQVAFNGFTFSNLDSITAGSFDDVISFLTGGSLDGAVDGGGGINLLTYAGYAGDVTVNLQLKTATGIAGGIANIRNVTGSIGNSLLVGDANANVLTGGTGRNILIGGTGADLLIGGGGDNILIGDSTIYDTNALALASIFTEWTRTDLSFQQRVADLLSSSSLGYNGIYNLSKPAIISDASTDTLIGSNGLDWFFESKKVDDDTGTTAGDHVTLV